MLQYKFFPLIYGKLTYINNLCQQFMRNHCFKFLCTTVYKSKERVVSNDRSRSDKMSGWIAERHAFKFRYFFNIPF